MNLIDRQQLSNGLTVVVEEIPGIRSISVGIWVGTGSRHETPEINGISHLIEHMLFKGTETRSAKELAEVFDHVGGQVNAFTAKEYTCFYAKVLDLHFRRAMETLADMFFHSRFAPEELAKERKVIVEEIRMYEDTPDELVHDLLASVVWGDHPLGFNILGTEQTLQTFERQNLVDYLSQRYVETNTVITVAGHVRTDEVMAIVEELFGGPWNRRAERVITEPPTFTPERGTRVKQTEQEHFCLAVPGLPVDHEDLHAMILLNNTLGGTMSSRLFQSIREEKGMAYSIYSYHTAYRDTGLLGIYAGMAPEYTGEVVREVRRIFEDVAESGITEGELERGKEQVKGSLMLSLESTTSRMTRLGKNELLLGRHYTLDETLERIDAVTLEDVRRVAQCLRNVPAVAAVGPVPGEELERLFD
ncbi:MAG: insulinase family protein [Kyrpidia tusciae]|nr:pitrilysin family protein [Kyrpidia tusciae]MBE3553095.1 insulinase family protein [Kyrpidia tusciae]